MPSEKTVAVSFRVTPRFKRLLESASARENRSQTNMLETLLFKHCAKHGIEDGASLRVTAKRIVSKK